MTVRTGQGRKRGLAIAALLNSPTIAQRRLGWRQRIDPNALAAR